MLFRITAGGSIVLAQAIFAVFYLINQALVMWLYIETHAVPPWALVLLCLSKRVHSIFMLRMFNDGVTTLITNVALLLLIKRKWRWSLLSFSAALSVKMNVLLLAPSVAVILLQVSVINHQLYQLAEKCLHGLHHSHDIKGDAQCVYMAWSECLLRGFDADACLPAVHGCFICVRVSPAWLTYSVGCMKESHMYT